MRYKGAVGDQVELHVSPEAAIESACTLLDRDYEVYAIGTGLLGDSIGMAEISAIFAIWTAAHRSGRERFGNEPVPRAIAFTGQRSGSRHGRSVIAGSGPRQFIC